MISKEKVENALHLIGMPAGLNGFKYIVDILLLLDKQEWQCPKWSALYYCIADKNNVSESIIESSIRYAFKTTRNRNSDYKMIEHYIGFTNCESSNSLMQLYQTLKSEDSKSEKHITKLMLKEALLEILGTV